MLSRPAAVGRTESPLAGLGLQERLLGLIDRSSPSAGEGDALQALLDRLLPADPLSAARQPLDESGFFWLVIPCRLAASLGLDAEPRGRALVRDLAWLQYCVYGAFRVQDDLVDGETHDATLAVQTNHLLIEAARCASGHFDAASPFWSLFQEYIGRTSSAIVSLDKLQRATDRSPEEELALYADLSACLKISSAGVAVAAGREAFWRDRISPALDGFAVAAQIVDDLRDIRDDLAQGRVNHAAWFLCQPVFGATPEAIEAVVASNLATTDRTDRLLGRAAAVMEGPLARLESEACPTVHAYLDEYRKGLDGLADRIRRSRRELLGG